MYENITYEMIRDRMLARLPERLDKREGSVIWDTHSPTAIELQILYLELDVILREAYGDTASREFLVRRAKERGIYPREATKAVWKGEFSPPDIDVSGQRFNIGETNYRVTERIADGEYMVECETAGKAGNQCSGDMIPVEYIRNLRTARLSRLLIPGEDEEETEELRQRYFASFEENAFGGNRRDYLEKTNAIPGVGRTKVTRAWNHDMAPSRMIPTEAVAMWYGQVRETVDGEVRTWLDTVFSAARERQLTVGGTVLLTIQDSRFGAASDTLVQTVQTMMDPEENAGEGWGLAPIGHVVKVESAAERTVTIRSDLTFEEGYGWENLRESLEEAVSDYLLELRRAWADSPYLIVRISQIDNRLLGIPGVLDVQNTSINGSESNLSLEGFEIPVLGGVSE